MKTLVIALILVFSSSAFAQKTFDLKDASKYFNIKVTVVKCDDMYCEGKATFSFYKKGATRPYQVINLPDTSIQLDDSGDALVNTTTLYDKQSVVNIDDYNFDGMDDVAICNGTNGSYNGPSYNVYLSNKATKKFVLDRAFTKLASHLGMFTVDKTEKTLETFDKDGCCWHITERYEVVAGKPRKIFEETEDGRIADLTKIRITTKKLVSGKWKSSSKLVKREE